MTQHRTLFNFASRPWFDAATIRPTGRLLRKLILGALCLALIPCSAALADPADLSMSRAARLSHVEGGVQLLRGTSTEYQQALQNMPLLEGSRLVTSNDGRAEIQFEDGSIARITPNSSVSLNVLRRNSDGSVVTEVELLSGLGYFELRSSAGQQLDAVRFGTSLLTAGSNAVIRINRDAEPADVAILAGDAHLAGGTQFNLDLHANESVHFDESDPSRYYLGEGVAGDTWDQWNNDRDQALEQAASQESVVAAEQGNPDSPAWSDLDESGAWYSVPGYGSVWTPVGVGPGWDPYGSGHWVYYPGYGYAWVSGYSWGWLPYRCGGWNYFDFGWGWMPGQCGGLGFGYGFGSGEVFYDTPRGYIPPARPVLKGPPARITNMQRVIAVDRGSRSAPVRIANGNTPQPIVYQGQRLEPISAKYNPGRGTLWGTAVHEGAGNPGNLPTMGVTGTSVVQGSSGASGVEAGRSGTHPRPPFTIVNGEPPNHPVNRPPAYQPPLGAAPDRPLPPSRPTGGEMRPLPPVSRPITAPAAPQYSSPAAPHYSAPSPPAAPRYSAPSPPAAPHYSAPSFSPPAAHVNPAPAPSGGTSNKK